MAADATKSLLLGQVKEGAALPELAYDVTAHNPLGRVLKIGLSFNR